MIKLKLTDEEHSLAVKTICKYSPKEYEYNPKTGYFDEK